MASAAEGTSLAQLRLAQTFQLSPLEELILLACLAPELDAKYGRVYGYLHDDLTRRQPSLQLIASVARLYEGSATPSECCSARICRCFGGSW